MTSTLFQRSVPRVSALLLLLTAGNPICRQDRLLSQAARPEEEPIEVERALEPRPPCGEEPFPHYPALTDSAIVKSWSRSDLGDHWMPPACTGWTEAGFKTLVTIAGRFPHTSESPDLRQHIGAISQLRGLRYWSTTHKQWQVLIVDAYALTNDKDGQRRGDFTSADLKNGSVLYFEQVDNLSRATYKLHVLEARERRLVFGIENITTIRFHFLPIFKPGEVQSVYFLDRESDQVWRYYSLLRTGKNANGLIARNEASSINRAVAFYRYIVGIPSTKEPPAAP